MADSSYLTKVLEPFVVEWVSQKIGVTLKPGKVVVGRRADGSKVHFAFDGISDDRKTGLLVSSSHTLKSGGFRKLHVDASILLRAPFKRRIMVFINTDSRSNFLNKCDGLLPLHKIEILVCDELPPKIQRIVEDFQKTARAEVGDKGSTPKLGRRRG